MGSKRDLGEGGDDDVTHLCVCVCEDVAVHHGRGLSRETHEKEIACDGELQKRSNLEVVI